jgi:outer membrane murein-binding lipoprotein Lpp
MSKKWIIILAAVVLCWGCQSNSNLSATVEQQQKTINELSSKISKLEMDQTHTRQEMDSLKKEFIKVKDDIKKVQPKFVEGGIQEGGH